MSNEKSKTIAMTVAGVGLTFIPNKTAFNSLVNEMTMTNKVAPHVTYLGRIISPECKTQLNELLENYPGVEMQIAEKVNSVYAPQVEIELKN